MSEALLKHALGAHVEAAAAFFAAQGTQVLEIAESMAHTLAAEGKLLFCGNGGSACDAMHIAGEFVGRFVKERIALPALALPADSGIVTAVGNDYGFEQIFARQVAAYGRPGDVLVALSTSGSSKNVLEALAAARAAGLKTVLMTGEKGRKQKKHADWLLVVPSSVTARVQEVHMLTLHLLAELVEGRMFGE